MKPFTCTNCGGHRLEKVMTDVIVSSRVTDVIAVGPNAVACEYGEQSNEDSEVDHYQCMDCGQEVSIDCMLALADPENIVPPPAP